MKSLIFARELKNRDSLYLQIAAGLRRSIAQGNYDAGEKLPAISDMAKELGVSVVTVRNAIAVLAEEGLIESFQGKGTFVASDAQPCKGLVLNTSFKSLLDHLVGKKTRILEASDGELVPLVDPKFGELAKSYHYMRRVHLADDVPYALINIHISAEIYERDKRRFERGMVIPILAEMPEVIHGRMHQAISFTTADPETALHLEVPINSPVGNVLRIITNNNNRIIYVGQTKYRGDFVKLEINYDQLGETMRNEP